jgi:two-component system, chemotaxis family, CheB/CheR fusion protein
MKQISFRSKQGKPDVRLLIGVGVAAGGESALVGLLKSIEPGVGWSLLLVHTFGESLNAVMESAKGQKWEFVFVENREQLSSGKVYVVPPAHAAEVKNGLLQVAPIECPGNATPIDLAFQSLANEFGEQSVGIVLSGNGSDGTIGLKTIGNAGGVTFAQSPASAEVKSMPECAAASGVVDHLLPMDELAAELSRYVRFMLKNTTQARRETALLAEVQGALPTIAELLLERTGHDFQHYKQSTLSRRVLRRMQLLKLGTIEEYLAQLRSGTEEPSLLFRDLLIGVTAFFRDREAFQLLAAEVIPKLFHERPAGETVRLWVPGCSSGEEAYSIAILCREEIERRGKGKVQVFATDIDDEALRRARRGAYPSGIHDQIPAEYLGKYFMRSGKQYHVAQEIRELVLFSKHNLISDPPFTRQDMISCRNLLIYLGPHLQNKLIPLFHYALQPGGYLILGPSENLVAHQELFRVIDPKHRIAQRREAPVGPLVMSPSEALFEALRRSPPGGDQPSPGLGGNEAEVDIYQLMQRIVLDEFSPKAVVINDDGQVVCSSGNIHTYLAIPTGSFRNNIYKLARGGVSISLRALVAEARQKRRRVSNDNLSIRIDGLLHRLMLTVQPMPELGEGVGLYLVVFHDLGLPISQDAQTGERDIAFDRDAAAIIAQLERELEITRSDLERSVQDMEVANEELKSTNEELLSINEELQSANEELEISKEEIQASSEALSQANSDLENLLRSTQIATIFLDGKQRIRSYTPAATEIYGLIATDIGRPLSQLRSLTGSMPDMPSPAEILAAESIEHTFTGKSNKTYMRRVLPYRNANGDYDGMVITFTDVSEMERTRRDLELRERQLQMMTDAVPAMIAYVDGNRRYRFVNRGYCNQFELNRDQIIGLTVEELLGSHNYAQVSDNLDAALAGEHVAYEYQWHKGDDPSVGPRYFSVNYVPDTDDSGGVLGCYVMIIDFTERKQQGLALADRERRLQSLISSTAEGIYGVNVNGICTFANSACARLLGYNHPDELLGKEMHALFHHSHADGTPYSRSECLIFKAIQQGKQMHVDEEVFWRADGSYFDVEYWSYPQRDDQGEVIGCAVTFLDVTERRKWERDLADREAHLRRVIDNMLGFVGILALDGTLLEANATAILAAGVGRNELVGCKFWDCYWWSFSPQSMATLQASVERAAAGESLRYDAEIRVANDARITIDFLLVPVFDAHGNVTHIIPSGIDISDRLRAEAAYRATSQAIRDNEERLAMALRAGGMAAWEWTPRGSVWTEEVFELLGIPTNQPPSVETLFQAVHPEDLPELRRAWEHAIESRSSFDQEFRIVRCDGSVRWIVGMGKVVVNDRDEVVSLFGLYSDSTQAHLAADTLRESERRAQEANLAKSEFIANMSHEIRTPMTAVLGYTDLLLAKEDEPEKIEHLRTIKRNGKFLLEIINDILDLSKIEAGKLEIERHPFAPQEVFEDVQSMMKVRARARQLEFRLGYTSRIPAEIQSDAKRLKQILVNLVGNAIKFTEQGGVDLWVSFEELPRPRLRFDVVDTGIGMTAEQQAHLFQPFSQGDASVTRKFGGTGLGLAISRRLAKMLGGEIWVQSELNRGSTFTCIIDVGELESVPMIDANTSSTPQALPTPAKPLHLACRVLVVDDRRDVRHLTKHFLVRAGAEVDLAEDGQQALDMISREIDQGITRYDLVLLDMQMPRLDGYETARALRKLGFDRPIIALTADAMQGDMTRCIESGCDSYLSKPIDGPALLATVALHVRQ